MADIKAFRALRYQEGKISSFESVCCPPYDIISPEEQKELYEKCPNNVIRLELNADKDRYQGAKRELDRMLAEGVLKQDEMESLYVYEEEFSAYGQRRKIKGLISLVKLEEFSKEIILPHEETISKAKTDRFNLMKATGCNFSQIYSLYMDNRGVIFKKIEELSKKAPAVEFTDHEGIVHRLWQVTDQEAIAELQRRFSGLQLFIADGHHRYETALNYRNFLKEEGIVKDAQHNANYVMMFLANMENEGLVVFPTHRIVRNLEHFDSKNILNQIAKNFMVEERSDLDRVETVLLEKADDKVFAFYCGGEKYYLLTLKEEDAVQKRLPDMSGAYCGLDVTTLHTLILEEAFGIDKENMANQKNLIYTRDIGEALQSVKSGEAQCAFLINPTKVREIEEVSLAHEKMPQKSTYFYPKLITGLAMNKIL